jgi:hypothetical protein
MSTLFILDNKQSNQINLKLLRYIYNNLDTIHVKVKKVDRNIMEVLKKNKITRLPVLIVKNNTYIGLSEIMNYCEKLKKDNSLGFNNSNTFGFNNSNTFGFNNSNTLEKYYEEELKSNEEETSLGEEIKKNTRNNGNVNGNVNLNKSNNGNVNGNDNITKSNNNITKSNNNITIGKKEIQDDEDSKDDMMINAYLTNMHLSMN